jgi:hypothetical protein
MIKATIDEGSVTLEIKGAGNVLCAEMCLLISQFCRDTNEAVTEAFKRAVTEDLKDLLFIHSEEDGKKAQIAVAKKMVEKLIKLNNESK